MAIAGDIIIKLAADFADYAQGMLKSSKVLEDFGKQAEKTNEAVSAVVGFAKAAGTALVAAFSVDKVIAYVDNIQKMSVEIAKVGQQYNLTAREVQGLQRQAEATGQPLSKLAEYAKTHGEWLENATLEAEKLGLVIDGKVVRSMKEMNDEAEEANRRLAILFAGPANAAKSWVVEALDRMRADLAALSANSGIIETIAGIVRMLTYGGSAGSGQAFQLGEYQIAVQNAEKTIADLDRQKGQAAIGMGYPVDAGVMDAARKRLDEARTALGQYKDAQAQAAYGGTLPATVSTAAAPTGGGGGGKTDADNLDAQIARFKALEGAAKTTAEAIAKYHATNIEDFQREIRVQQRVEEIAAKLGAKYSEASEEKKKELHDRIAAALEAESANARALEGAQRAADIERKYGDGAAASAKARRDLDLAEQANIATKGALARATKVQAEADEHQRLQAKRYSDNLDSLAAGFKDAADSYSRANDLFTQGGQLFAGVTSAMGEGLDVLMGKSTKTFGQIAADFANMLTKMALQAALSPVFKLISKSIGDYFGTSGVTPPPLGGTDGGSFPAGAGTSRAGGGAVYGGQPYWVGEYGPERFVPQGAGRIEPAGGGDVYVNIANYTDSKVSASKSKGPGGKMQVDVLVEAVEAQIAGRVSRGQGALGKTLEGTYGMQRVGR